MNTKKLLKHPLTWLSGSLGGLLIVDPSTLLAVATVVWTKAGTIFTAASVTAFTVVPEVSALSALEEAAVAIAISAAGVYIAKLGYRIYDSYTNQT
jgi:hypothetical protein